MKLIFLTLILSISCAQVDANFKRFAPCPDKPNCVSSRSDSSDVDHYIAPIKTSTSQSVALIKLKNIMSDRARVQLVKEEGTYLHYESTTAIFRFTDDLEFQLEDGLIHVSSRSRLGYSDLGKNRSRVEEIRKLFNP